ncbi:MAG TPA: ATP-binding cassette domain-containing protein [Ktedonobacteraceae bacterium]|nr:ATP-binding cassette domain-containing protein [Ktedonobacteraceae bacterium]
MSEENKLLFTPGTWQSQVADSPAALSRVEAAKDMMPAFSTRQAESAQPVIVVDHLIKRYKKAETNAVDDVSFHVLPGSFFALLGPNGAGKSTIISILTTTLSKTSGRIQVAGYDPLSRATEVRRHIGIVFQRPSLDLNLSAEENVRLHAALYGLYPYRPFFAFMPRAYKQRVRELAALLDIEKALFKPAKTFSGGMKRKLEIMRSLLHRPDVLFLDEPTTGLDPDSRHSLWEYLGRVRRESGTTIFLTTHYLEEAEEADVVSIMNHGRVVAAGTPAQIKAELTAPALLLDSPERERLRTELRTLKLDFQEESHFRLNVSGQDVQRVLQMITTPLHLVRTYAPTLEDVYLKLVREEA